MRSFRLWLTRSESPNEVRWREEFEHDGEVTVRRRLAGGYYTAEGKTDFGYRWLDERDKARFSREVWAARYARWTFWAALVAVAVGIAGLFMTWYLRTG